MRVANIADCRGCHQCRLEPVLVMDPMPLAGVFCADAAEAARAPVFPLTWVFCGDCGLVQVLENIDDADLFLHYNYSSSTVAGLVAHFESYAAFLSDRYGQSRDVSLMEIGCNDGVLLNRLPRAWKLTGVDPSDVARRAHCSDTPYQLIEAPFGMDLVHNAGLVEAFDVVTGSNCLAHISDLQAVFREVWLALRVGGEFWIEVHDLDALLDGAQWDTIYHEHKAEWSEGALVRCLTPLGFEHAVTIRTPMHGGALRIAFRKVARARADQVSVQPSPQLRRLRTAYEKRHESPAVRRLMMLQAEGKRVAAYGAAGRANVYLNQMRTLAVDFIVDESPLRRNKFLPGVCTPVVSRDVLADRRPAACLVTAWNYRDEIVRKNSEYSGEWLTAFPWAP